MTTTKQAAAVAAILAATLAPVGAQRRGASPGGVATFAVLVSDPAGAPINDVKVTASGPAERGGRTESGGRLVFEGVPTGTYRFRFDKDGYLSFEREVTTKGSVPVDVKVTLTAAPLPPKPAEPAPPPPPPPAEHTVDAKVMALDL